MTYEECVQILNSIPEGKQGEFARKLTAGELSVRDGSGWSIAHELAWRGILPLKKISAEMMEGLRDTSGQTLVHAAAMGGQFRLLFHYPEEMLYETAGGITPAVELARWYNGRGMLAELLAAKDEFFTLFLQSKAPEIMTEQVLERTQAMRDSRDGSTARGRMAIFGSILNRIRDAFDVLGGAFSWDRDEQERIKNRHRLPGYAFRTEDEFSEITENMPSSMLRLWLRGMPGKKLFFESEKTPRFFPVLQKMLQEKFFPEKFLLPDTMSFDIGEEGTPHPLAFELLRKGLLPFWATSAQILRLRSDRTGCLLVHSMAKLGKLHLDAVPKDVMLSRDIRGNTAFHLLPENTVIPKRFLSADVLDEHNNSGMTVREHLENIGALDRGESREQEYVSVSFGGR